MDQLNQMPKRSLHELRVARLTWAQRGKQFLAHSASVFPWFLEWFNVQLDVDYSRQHSQENLSDHHCTTQASHTKCLLLYVWSHWHHCTYTQICTMYIYSLLAFSLWGSLMIGWGRPRPFVFLTLSSCWTFPGWTELTDESEELASVLADRHLSLVGTFYTLTIKFNCTKTDSLGD